MSKTEEALLALVEEAFRDGYCARETYNDKDTSDVDTEWQKAKPHFAALAQRQQVPEDQNKDDQ